MYGCATAPVAPPPAPTVEAAPTIEEAPAPAAKEAPAVELQPLPSDEMPTVQPIMPGMAEGAERHIALILPLHSPSFGRAAEIVRQGFMAAASVQSDGWPVRVYAAKDEQAEVVALYQQAVQEGALAVAGPLTRNGVMVLAEKPDLPVPTLALNTLEARRSDPLYFFGLPPESEVAQIVRWAAREGLRTATVVRTDSAYSRRVGAAFSEAWLQGGGSLKPEIVYQGNPDEIATLTGEAGEMVFLAAEPDKARFIRPYIHINIPVYATSQIFADNQNTLRNFDLSEVRFVDMPWLLQPDHPAVMVYPRADPALALKLERLYALGVDAYRLLQVLIRQDTDKALPLDGVTGQLTLDDHLVQREGVQAVMRGGRGMALAGSGPFRASKR